MNMDLTYRNIRATDAIKGRAEKKFQKVAKHLREPIDAHIVLRAEKHRHIAEATVSGSGEVFKVQEETDDMYATIDGLMSKLERQVRRHKERVNDRQQAGSGDAGGAFDDIVFGDDQDEV